MRCIECGKEIPFGEICMMCESLLYGGENGALGDYPKDFPTGKLPNVGSFGVQTHLNGRKSSKSAEHDKFIAELLKLGK